MCQVNSTLYIKLVGIFYDKIREDSQIGELNFNNNRILVVTYDYFSHYGGASRIAQTVAEMLIDNGWDVHVLTHDKVFNPKNDYIEKIFSYNSLNNIEFRLPPGQYLWEACNLWQKAKKLHRRYHYRVVYAHHYIAGLALIDFKQEKGVSTVFTCHGIRKNHFSCFNLNDPAKSEDVYEAWNTGIQASMTEAMHVLETQSIYNADKVTCVSNYMAKEMIDVWPKITPEVIHNFYCLEDRVNYPVYRIKGKLKGKNLVAFIGRWEKTKGCDIVNSIAEKLSTYNNFFFVHAGLIIDTPKPKKVIQLGHLGDSELAWLYQKSDLVIMPSRYEPFGLTAIEAMWHGTPVLAHRIGGLVELINEGVNGWFLPNLDINTWVSKILELFASEDIRPLRKQVKEYTRRKFSPLKSLELYKQFFSQFFT